MAKKKYCFVIMPFLPELHYFYLYLRDYMERERDLVCERADEQVYTIAFLDKIIAFIQKADVVIADCSGKNPNVFYELGIAHTLGKKVILITKDEIKEVPSDLKQFEFIKYDLSKDVEFYKALGNALDNIFVKEYEALYAKAEAIFAEFQAASGANISMTPKPVFNSFIRSSEIISTVLVQTDEHSMRELLLPKIVRESTQPEIMKSIVTWLGDKKKECA